MDIGHNLVQILSQNRTWFDFFFAVFQWSILENSINIKNFNWNPVVLKKSLLKPLKITIFRPAQLVQKWGPHGPHPKQKKKFFSEITKPDPKSFYFNKMSNNLAELWIFFCTVWCFFAKKVSFPAHNSWRNQCFYQYRTIDGNLFAALPLA